jgi:hypothetical protein
LTVRECAKKAASGCSSGAIEDVCCDLPLADPTPPEPLVKVEEERRVFAFHATITPLDPAAVMTDESSYNCVVASLMTCRWIKGGY